MCCMFFILRKYVAAKLKFPASTCLPSFNAQVDAPSFCPTTVPMPPSGCSQGCCFVGDVLQNKVVKFTSEQVSNNSAAVPDVSAKPPHKGVFNASSPFQLEKEATVQATHRDAADGCVWEKNSEFVTKGPSKLAKQPEQRGRLKNCPKLFLLCIQKVAIHCPSIRLRHRLPYIESGIENYTRISWIHVCRSVCKQAGLKAQIDHHIFVLFIACFKLHASCSVLGATCFALHFPADWGCLCPLLSLLLRCTLFSWRSWFHKALSVSHTLTYSFMHTDTHVRQTGLLEHTFLCQYPAFCFLAVRFPKTLYLSSSNSCRQRFLHFCFCFLSSSVFH